MYGTLRGALAGRKIEFDRDGYTASVEGRIVGIGKTIRIASIHVHYELAVPADAREATERALARASSGLSRPSERQGRHRHHLGGHAPGRRGGADRPQRGWVARTTRERTTHARGGRVTRRGPGVGPPTTADSVPVTRGGVPTPRPLCRRHAGRKGSEDPPPGPRRVTRPITRCAFASNARWLTGEPLPRVVRRRVGRSGTGVGGRGPRGASRPGPPPPPALASLDRC